MQLCEGQLGSVAISYSGDIGLHDVSPLKAAVIRGLLAPISEEQVTIVNADLVAQRRGMRIEEHKGPSHDIYSNLITVRLATKAGDTTISGTVAHDGPHIVLVNDYWVEHPAQRGLPADVREPGPAGMIGAIGTMLGDLNVNISFMNVGAIQPAQGLMVLMLDEALSRSRSRSSRASPTSSASSWRACRNARPTPMEA